MGRMTIRCLALWGHRDLFCNGPHKSYAFTRNSDDNLVRMFASGNQVAMAFAQPYLGLPADVLDGLGLLFESQLQMATDFGGKRYAHAPSTSARRAWVLPALVREPCRRRSPLEYSERIRPKDFLS